ncbi:MAG: CoA pyrophosphatase [Ancalomicrobiaceae bacterium]|nr:CoA pyrophosphatase [Ancalomicrobiaceae bacterium]
MTGPRRSDAGRGADAGRYSADSFVRRAAPHISADAATLWQRPHYGDRLWQEQLGAAVAAGRRTGTSVPYPAGTRFGGRYRDAAVLFGIIDHGPDARLILTERTAHLNSHAGQVALPGGKIDAGDSHPIAAALREAEEEIGLDPAHVEPIGYFFPYLTGSGFRIAPVLARVRPGFSLIPNADEVAEVFEVPLSFLMDDANHRIASRVFEGRTRYFYEMPYGDHHIWGVTAGIIRQIFEVVYGVG